MEITKREVFVSVAIVFFMAALGFLISGKIGESSRDFAEKYRTALKIDSDSSALRWAAATGAGDALVTGVIEARSPVTEFDHVFGEFFALRKMTERYTKHVKTVDVYEYVDGERKKVGTEKEVEYTWDDYGSVTKYCPDFEFLEMMLSSKAIFNQLSFKRLGLSAETVFPQYIDKIQSGVFSTYLYDETRWFGSHNEGDKRHYYLYIPASVPATLFAKLSGATMSEIKVYENSSISSVIETVESSAQGQLVVFWVGWFVLIAGLVAGFYFLENWWLNK